MLSECRNSVVSQHVPKIKTPFDEFLAHSLAEFRLLPAGVNAAEVSKLQFGAAGDVTAAL